MSVYNLNPRRVVWFSPNEPSNKYDIWLSRNAHLDENGEPTTDSNSQRDCDYIFKIYDCGKWNPIVGFNTTAANKIDCVENNTLYHPAIFTGQNPNDISDNGSLGELLADSHYVNEQEWEDIFNTSQFQQAFNTQVIDGDDYNWESLIETTVQELLNDGEITIPASQIEWRRATTSLLGGIKASVFRSIIPQEEIAEACFNDNLVDQAQNNDRLYIWAKDMMQAIQAYTEDHSEDSDFPSIVPPGVVPDDEVPTLLYNWFWNSPSIMKGWQEQSPSLGGNKPRFEIWGVNRNNAGKILTLQPISWWDGDHPTGYDPYDINHNAINWMSPEELFGEYSLPLASLGALGGIRANAHLAFPRPHVVECKLGTNLAFPENNQYKKQALHIDVKDVKNALDEWYADNDSTEWDLNLKASYGIVVRKQTFTDNDNNQIVSYTHSLSNYGQFTKEGMYCRTKFYNQSTPGVQNRDYSYNDTHGLEWVNAQTIVEEGLGIGTGNAGYLYYNGSDFYLDPGTGGGSGGSVTLPPYLQQGNCNSQGERIIYVPNGGTGGNKKYLNGYGEWSVPEGTTYNDFRGSTHGLVPASTQQTQDKYLKGDGTWGTPTVSAEFDIDMDSAAISDDYSFTLSNMSLTSTNTNKTLREWHYYEIDCGSKTIQFTFSNTHVSGNAIYLRINTNGNPVQINTDSDLILSNLTMSSSRRQLNANSSYLVTIQFGIIKIEMIAPDKSTSENTNS